jgi:hypothetical protein
MLSLRSNVQSELFLKYKPTKLHQARQQRLRSNTIRTNVLVHVSVLLWYSLSFLSCASSSDKFKLRDFTTQTKIGSILSTQLTNLSRKKMKILPLAFVRVLNLSGTLWIFSKYNFSTFEMTLYILQCLISFTSYWSPGASRSTKNR